MELNSAFLMYNISGVKVSSFHPRRFSICSLCHPRLSGDVKISLLISLPKLLPLLMNNLFFNPIADLPNEEWRPIPDTNDLYHVSNLGRIKRIAVNKQG